ncbi:Usher syndrome type-1G protein homolog [Gigantopelta aegis]|uniref:Usher syndrome type-1G protein homolog n=1 Tax=Gigantopelta aegis TaxID=1735272 RepID=UPI001B88C4F5|nr:Usher syndrome type-1G protein homolog [Gigantopelta aegis]
MRLNLHSTQQYAKRLDEFLRLPFPGCYHLGMRNEQLIVFQLLFDHSCNEDRITPVHQAASEGHVQCLKLLIEHGADVHARDCRDNTPLDLAKLWGHRKCARILAAEMWHQNKDYVAKELSQLKKLKMQHVLQEIERCQKMPFKRRWLKIQAVINVQLCLSPSASMMLSQSHTQQRLIGSAAFWNSKYRMVDESEASCSSGSPNLDAFPRELVANTIKQMSKPDCFPNIQGPEYEINFGDISGVF